MKKEYLTEREVSKLTGRAISTLRNDRKAGRGFPFIRWGNRWVRYRKKDVLDFMEGHKIITNEAQADGAKDQRSIP